MTPPPDRTSPLPQVLTVRQSIRTRAQVSSEFKFKYSRISGAASAQSGASLQDIAGNTVTVVYTYAGTVHFAERQTNSAESMVQLIIRDSFLRPINCLFNRACLP
jgi:hypothetical protein